MNGRVAARVNNPGYSRGGSASLALLSLTTLTDIFPKWRLVLFMLFKTVI